MGWELGAKERAQQVQRLRGCVCGIAEELKALQV